MDALRPTGAARTISETRGVGAREMRATPTSPLMERRRRGRYLAWGVSPRYREINRKLKPPEGCDRCPRSGSASLIVFDGVLFELATEEGRRQHLGDIA